MCGAQFQHYFVQSLGVGAGISAPNSPRLRGPRENIVDDADRHTRVPSFRLHDLPEKESPPDLPGGYTAGLAPAEMVCGMHRRTDGGKDGGRYSRLQVSLAGDSGGAAGVGWRDTFGGRLSTLNRRDAEA